MRCVAHVRDDKQYDHDTQITDVLDAMTKMYKVVGDGQRADSFMRLSSVLRFLDRR